MEFTLACFSRSTRSTHPLSFDARFSKVPVTHLQIESLAGRVRASDVVRAREMLATLGVERHGLRAKNIATEFKKSAEAASRMVSRGVEKRLTNSEFREEFDGLDRHLARAAK